MKKKTILLISLPLVLALCLLLIIKPRYTQYQSNHSTDVTEKVVPNDNTENAMADNSEGDNQSNNEQAVTEESISYNLNIKRIVQENAYYCVPAAMQMVLQHHGIHVSQSQLAKDMITSPATGTEYVDLQKVANKYIFGNENVGPLDPGYRVQELSKGIINDEITSTFISRIRSDIETNDPIFVAVDTQTLNPESASMNHIILITGYTVNKETDDIIYFHYIDPSYVVTMPSDGSQYLHITQEKLIQALINNVEPAYIW